jgi:hypothetical protein
VNLSGGQADQLVMLMLVLGLLAVAVLVFRADARVALTCWVVTIGFVPVYFAVPLGISWMPATLVGSLVLLTTVPWGERRLGIPDALVVAFFVALIIPVLVPGSWTRTSVIVAITQWGLAFLLGRLLLGGRLGARWVYGMVAVVMTAVAGLALVEFGLQWNPFVGTGLPWGATPELRELQIRGGIMRAEGAFGHSIALGCSLALAIPLALGSALRPAVRNVMVLVLLLGAVVSFSRLGMVSGVLGLVLSVLAGSAVALRVRISAMVATAVAAVLVLPLVLGVFGAASEESSVSANYRLDLLSLVPSMEYLGFSEDARLNAVGRMTFRGYQSIDSAMILLGLTYGWIALGIAACLLGLAVASVLLRRAAPPTIAVVAQIPALLSVALITQYAMLFWFVAGLAVAAQVREPAPSAPSAGAQPRPTSMTGSSA